MGTFGKAAKEAGVDVVVCPSCGNKFSTNEVLRRFFTGVLELVRRGEQVFVPQFGSFVSKMWKGRSHKTPIIPSGEVKFGDTWVLRFKPARAAKVFLNKPRTKQSEAVSAANKKRLEAARQEEAKALREARKGG
jgi:nucleoid DNA-binding protein